MKKIITFLFVFAAITAVAQEWAKNITQSNPNFYDIQKAFNEYYETHIPSWEADDDYKAFKRWEYFMEPRVYPSGEFMNADATWQVLQNNPVSLNKNMQTTASASWTSMGPQLNANGMAGIGRVDCIQFDPTNATTVWLGAAGGGLWKSINSGSNWMDYSNNLPNLSVADIVIHPAGTNTMFIATGDGFGYIGGSGGSVFWGGTYSTGVMKSTNGGSTWTVTPLNYTVGQRQIINRLIMHPINHDTLLAVGTDGINRTVNGGNSWTKVKSGRFYDIEFNTNNPDIVYAVRDSVFRSLDGGATWSVLTGSPKFTGRVAVETTAANDSVIYAMDQSKKFVKSTDAGATWTTYTITGLTLYGYYDNVLSVSPVDENTVYVAGYNMYKTINGGSSWSQVGTSIHVDHHVIEFIPGTNSIYCGNDGGVYRSTNGGTSWTDFTSGLMITQFYRLGSSFTNPGIVYAGAQDNGTKRRSGTTWSTAGGGDGMECLVDYTNSNIVYISSQNGAFSKSTNGGASFSGINTGGGAWLSPMVIDPLVNTTLYFGGKEVRKSTDGGNTWNNLSTNLTASVNLAALAVAKSNPNYIYAAKYNAIYVTTNGGTTWSTINTGLPLSSNAITYIAVSATDPSTAWVTLSGYNNGQKVYKTINAGASWTNISGALPNIPANCIVYDENSPLKGIYVGTDLGVYYLDSTLAGVWQNFSTGLPNVMVYELEINLASNKLIAATYGRGLWETQLPTITTGIKASIEPKSTISIYPNPTNGVFSVDIQSVKDATDIALDIYNITGQKVLSLSREFTKTKHYQVDLTEMPAGIYLLNVTTRNETRVEKIIVSR